MKYPDGFTREKFAISSRDLVIPMLKLKSISKRYRTAEVETLALQDINFDIRPGEFAAITGPSGCGKSTLLNILGLLDKPSGGEYRFFDEQVEGMSERQLTLLRRASIGFIFQNFNLIGNLDVAENVEVALLYRGLRRRERREKVVEALDMVELSHRSHHLPQQLSGGQQQRVAIARAIVAKPSLILADEPTGNLDTTNGEAIMRLLQNVVESGTSVVMVTHSPIHAQCASRVVEMLDGRIVQPQVTRAS